MTAATGPGEGPAVRLRESLPRLASALHIEDLPGLLAVALILYLPLEGLTTGHLQGAAYWIVRLAPDGCVAAVVASVMLVPGRHYRPGILALWAIAVVVGVAIAVYAVRGFPATTTVNALRVLVRFLALGAAILATEPDPRRLVRRLAASLAGAAVVQAAIAAAEVVWNAAHIAGTGRFPSPNLILGVNGTLDRYDQLGALMAAFVLLALAGALPRLGRIEQGRNLTATTVAIGLAVLAFSTSRQAMLALAVAAGAMSIWPGRTAAWRAGRVAAALLALSLVVIAPVTSATPAALGEDTSAPPFVVPTTGRAGTEITLNPNRNFRLYLTAVLAPWAVSQEPLLGFGPAQQDAAAPDARLSGKVAADGMPWGYARYFTSDSNFAEMLIQFGLILPALYLAGLAAAVWMALRRALANPSDGWPLFAVGFATACLVLALFGPAFETRIVSAVMWLALFSTLALARPGRARQA